MSFVRFTVRPTRLYIADRRVHHFWVGLLIALSDYRDWRVWVPDLLRTDKANDFPFKRADGKVNHGTGGAYALADEFQETEQ